MISKKDIRLKGIRPVEKFLKKRIKIHSFIQKILVMVKIKINFLTTSLYFRSICRATIS